MTFIIGTPHAKGAGYYRNDDTPSGGSLSEADVRTCSHCQRIIKMQAWKDDGGFCSRCMAPVCVQCADEMDRLGCVPFLKRLEQTLDATVKYRAYLKQAGLEPAAPQPVFTGILRS